MSSMLDMLGIKTGAPEIVPVPQKPQPATTSVPGSIADAARAVSEAIRADTGRKKKADRFKPVASEVLGLKRLHPKRWKAVLVYGVREGLFTLDESGKFPLLVPLDPPEVTEKKEDEDYSQVQPEKPPAPENTVPKAPPENWTPPPILDCGHLNFRSDESIAKAQEEGKCCADPKGPIHWQFLKGKYLKPVPEKSRRTAEKSGRPGHPGYCCNEEGFYQGGSANCHIYENPQGVPCGGCNLRRRKRTKE